MRPKRQQVPSVAGDQVVGVGRRHTAGDAIVGVVAGDQLREPPGFNDGGGIARRTGNLEPFPGLSYWSNLHFLHDLFFNHYLFLHFLHDLFFNHYLFLHFLHDLFFNHYLFLHDDRLGGRRPTTRNAC